MKQLTDHGERLLLLRILEVHQPSEQQIILLHQLWLRGRQPGEGLMSFLERQQYLDASTRTWVQQRLCGEVSDSSPFYPLSPEAIRKLRDLSPSSN
jgi:hypothetical protein